jgi:hypothetical protein
MKGATTMRTIAAAMTGFVFLTMVSGAAAQVQLMTPPGGQSSQDPHAHPSVTSPGMPGGMMMCPMMGQGMMGMGPSMMGGTMGAPDPKAMARMLKLRGDMMKAMGEVMLKHAQALEQEK